MHYELCKSNVYRHVLVHSNARAHSARLVRRLLIVYSHVVILFYAVCVVVSTYIHFKEFAFPRWYMSHFLLSLRWMLVWSYMISIVYWISLAKSCYELERLIADVKNKIMLCSNRVVTTTANKRTLDLFCIQYALELYRQQEKYRLNGILYKYMCFVLVVVYRLFVFYVWIYVIWMNRNWTQSCVVFISHSVKPNPWCGVECILHTCSTYLYIIELLLLFTRTLWGIK